ncbi:hypothetical protein EXIGLDRAFT_475626 [Exidia glandulosa HHB12029]|uniref:Uncharacterized protein n=1 Tax=Exidia glandulosa HHB12029 TaxID=1314781 RepID=A0A166NL05_EXIGL|nr:hypothetical protein EXIGLDRAFT_475626 [Exidia glandulosa HHB12029]
MQTKSAREAPNLAARPSVVWPTIMVIYRGGVGEGQYGQTETDTAVAVDESILMGNSRIPCTNASSSRARARRLHAARAHSIQSNFGVIARDQRFLEPVEQHAPTRVAGLRDHRPTLLLGASASTRVLPR